MKRKHKRGLIVALDVETPENAKALVRRIGDAVDFYKLPPCLAMADPELISWLVAVKRRVSEVTTETSVITGMRT